MIDVRRISIWVLLAGALAAGSPPAQAKGFYFGHQKTIVTHAGRLYQKLVLTLGSNAQQAVVEGREIRNDGSGANS